MGSSSSGGAGGVVAIETQSSTCTWTQRRDASGRCVLRARSCYSCLNTLPTSQESCTLAPDGICLGADAYDATRDYRRMGPSSAWPPHLNLFPAANATYCERDDPACAGCRERSFKNWESNPSQYCEGQSGCVCVSICESDSWEAAVQPALRQALAAANGSLANCSIEEVSSQDVEVAAPSSLSDFVGLGATKAIYAGEDQCMWVQKTYCGEPRSCWDCLNSPVYSGARCMLHSSGYCTSMISYDHGKDFRLKTRWNDSIALFPSTNATYCAASDAACARCRQDPAFTQWSGVTSEPRFCVGANGCVCVASCESALWKSAVVELTCNTSAVDKLNRIDVSANRMSPVAYWSISALALLMTMVCALLGLSCMRRWQQHQFGRRRQRSRLPQGPTLELSGWKAMREKFIETEREFIGGDGTLPHLEGRRLRATSAEGAEPETGPRSPRGSSEAPGLVVEEGDAFRPVSPSRMHV